MLILANSIIFRWRMNLTKWGLDVKVNQNYDNFVRNVGFLYFLVFFGEKTIQSGGWTCKFLKIRQILVQNVNFDLFYHINVADEPFKVRVFM